MNVYLPICMLPCNNAILVNFGGTWYCELGCGLDYRGSRFRFRSEAGKFSFHHRFRTSSKTHTASYPRGTGGSFLGGKAAGTWSSLLTYI